jgi:hypothetical protein
VLALLVEQRPDFTLNEAQEYLRQTSRRETSY